MTSSKPTKVGSFQKQKRKKMVKTKIPYKCNYCNCQLYLENRVYWKGKYYCNIEGITLKIHKPEVDSSHPLDTKQEGGNGVPPTPKGDGYPT